MFKAVLLILYAGTSQPTAYDRPGTEQAFIGITACNEWAAQESRRIERAMASMDKRPEQWELRCVPVGPLWEALR